MSIDQTVSERTVAGVAGTTPYPWPYDGALSRERDGADRRRVERRVVGALSRPGSGGRLDRAARRSGRHRDHDRPRRSVAVAGVCRTRRRHGPRRSPDRARSRRPGIDGFFGGPLDVGAALAPHRSAAARRARARDHRALHDAQRQRPRLRVPARRRRVCAARPRCRVERGLDGRDVGRHLRRRRHSPIPSSPRSTRALSNVDPPPEGTTVTVTDTATSTDDGTSSADRAVRGDRRRPVHVAVRRRDRSEPHRAGQHRLADRLLRPGRLRRRDGLRPEPHPGRARADGTRARARRGRSACS